MNKIVFGLLLLAVLLPTAAQAQQLPPNVVMTLDSDQDKKPAASLPRFKALDELVFNAGEVEAPGAVSRDFTFINEGDAPLEIKEVKSGCGCLVASYDPLIQPGEKGTVSISMKVYPEWEGREISRTTWVATNDPLNPQIRLTMSAKAAARNVPRN